MVIGLLLHAVGARPPNTRCDAKFAYLDSFCTRAVPSEGDTDAQPSGRRLMAAEYSSAAAVGSSGGGGDASSVAAYGLDPVRHQRSAKFLACCRRTCTSGARPGLTPLQRHLRLQTLVLHQYWLYRSASFCILSLIKRKTARRGNKSHVLQAFNPASSLFDADAVQHINDYYNTTRGSGELSPQGVPYGFFRRLLPGYEAGVPAVFPVRIHNLQDCIVRSALAKVVRNNRSASSTMTPRRGANQS